MSVVRNVTKEETVQYVLALLVQMLDGERPFPPPTPQGGSAVVAAPSAVTSPHIPSLAMPPVCSAVHGSCQRSTECYMPATCMITCHTTCHAAAPCCPLS